MGHLSTFSKIFNTFPPCLLHPSYNYALESIYQSKNCRVFIPIALSLLDKNKFKPKIFYEKIRIVTINKLVCVPGDNSWDFYRLTNENSMEVHAFWEDNCDYKYKKVPHYCFSGKGLRGKIIWSSVPSRCFFYVFESVSLSANVLFCIILND